MPFDSVRAMPRKFKALRAIGEGAKDTVAVALITLGIQQIQGGDYIAGGALVAIGWILLVIDRYVL